MKKRLSIYPCRTHKVFVHVCPHVTGFSLFNIVKSIMSCISDVLEPLSLQQTDQQCRMILQSRFRQDVSDCITALYTAHDVHDVPEHTAGVNSPRAQGGSHIMATATLASINRSLFRRRISRQPHLRVFGAVLEFLVHVEGITCLSNKPSCTTAFACPCLPPPVNGEFARLQLQVIPSCVLNRADRAISSPPSGPRFHTSILHSDLSKRPASLSTAR